jgi:hypothetical protein
MTRNGKIARLSTVVREELNRRINNGEQGKSLVKWLNSLSEVQTITTAEFGGKPIREQNLSEWKKGGYRDWRARQERHEFIRQLEQEAEDLGAVMETEAINRHLSLVLTAELALAIRDVQQIADPKDRVRCLAQIVGGFARIRREESNASRAEIVREHWEEEVAKKEEQIRDGTSELMPVQALHLQERYIDMFGFGNVKPVVDAFDVADYVRSLSTDSSELNPTESD